MAVTPTLTPSSLSPNGIRSNSGWRFFLCFLTRRACHLIKRSLFAQWPLLLEGKWRQAAAMVVTKVLLLVATEFFFCCFSVSISPRCWQWFTFFAHIQPFLFILIQCVYTVYASVFQWFVAALFHSPATSLYAFKVFTWILFLAQFFYEYTKHGGFQCECARHRIFCVAGLYLFVGVLVCSTCCRRHRFFLFISYGCCGCGCYCVNVSIHLFNV